MRDAERETMLSHYTFNHDDPPRGVTADCGRCFRRDTIDDTGYCNVCTRGMPASPRQVQEIFERHEGLIRGSCRELFGGWLARPYAGTVYPPGVRAGYKLEVRAGNHWAVFGCTGKHEFELYDHSDPHGDAHVVDVADTLKELGA